MDPRTHRILKLLAVLALIEVAMVWATKYTGMRHAEIYERVLGDRSVELLSDAELATASTQASNQFDTTVYRKIDLAVIIYHFPALVSWMLLTGESPPPAVYYFGVTMILWLFLILGCMKLLGLRRSPQQLSKGQSN